MVSTGGGCGQTLCQNPIHQTNFLGISKFEGSLACSFSRHLASHSISKFVQKIVNEIILNRRCTHLFDTIMPSRQWEQLFEFL